MRIDSCRKCGISMREHEDAQRCKICGKEFEQFACARCQRITEPQYHIHKEMTPLIRA